MRPLASRLASHRSYASRMRRERRDVNGRSADCEADA
jgi:hypothetical protein